MSNNQMPPFRNPGEKLHPPKPPLLRVGANGNPCPACRSGMKAN